MKKLLLIATIALCVSASVFADGFIGAEAGAGINWMKYNPDDNDIFSVISFTAGAAGAHYFTDNIGLGYGLSMDFPQLYKRGDLDYQEETSAWKSIKGDVSFQFKHNFSRKFALEAGLGMYVFYSWTNENWSMWQLKSTHRLILPQNPEILKLRGMRRVLALFRISALLLHINR